MTDDPPRFPDDHPLAEYTELLDGHDGHLNVYSEVLADAAVDAAQDGDGVEAAMVVLTGQDGTETLPTVSEDVDPRWASLWMLGAHIHHVAAAGQASGDGSLTMEEAAQDAISYIRQHHGPEEVY